MMSGLKDLYSWAESHAPYPLYYYPSALRFRPSIWQEH